MLKTFAEEITPTLTKMFNKIILQERVPSRWKETEIILLFKNGTVITFVIE